MAYRTDYWCLHPLGESDALTIHVLLDDDSKCAVLFTTETRAKAFLWADSRNIEHAEPRLLPREHVLILLEWFIQHGYEFIAIDPGTDDCAICSITELQDQFQQQS